MLKIDNKTLQAELLKIETIPTLPDKLKNLLKVLENPKTSLTEISKFILNDPALTARVLRMVNSPIYGFPGKISSVNQALLLLGLNVVKGLLLSISIFETMQKAMVGLWDHSLGSAIAARIIAKKKSIPDPEEISIAALLHDIGKVVLSLRFPEEYHIVRQKAERDEIFIYEAEKEIFGITHSNAGALIAEKWNFPKKLIEIIEFHNRPESSKTVFLHTAIVHLADIITRARGYGFAGDNFVPSISPKVWDTLNLSEADIREILIHMEDSLCESEYLMLVDE